jgi:hypothetical protein
MKPTIRQVKYNKANKSKYIYLKKDSEFEPGDHVIIEKIQPEELQIQKE